MLNTSKHNPITDFNALRQIGIDTLQQLSGNQWSDYNLHDPGITILEQLCYALSDLGYRVSLPIPDLMGGKDYAQHFKTAAEILPTTEPVIPNDYRRLLMDIEGVQNAWAVNNQTECRVSLHIALEPTAIADDKLNQLSDLNNLSVVLSVPNEQEPSVFYRTRFTVTNLNDWNTLAKNPSPIDWRQYTFKIYDETYQYYTQTQYPLNKLEGIVYHRYRIQYENPTICPPMNRIELVVDCMEEQECVELTNTEYDINQASGIGNFMVYDDEAANHRYLPDGSNMGFWLTVAEDKETKVKFQENSRFYSYLYQFIKNPAALLPVIAAKEKQRAAVVQKIQENKALAEQNTSELLMHTQEIAINADVELKNGYNSEEIAHQILYELGQFMLPTPVSRSYQAMLQQGKTLDMLLESNYAREKGFVPDDQLSDLESYRPHLYPSEVQDFLIRRIPAIKSIQNLRLVQYINGIYETQTALLSGEIADKKIKNRLPHINLLRHATYKIRLPRVAALLSNLNLYTSKEKKILPFRLWDEYVLQYAEQHREKHHVHKQDNVLPIPLAGIDKPETLSQYYSIQHQFPLFYGIGHEGLLPNEPQQRHAQAKQLKAYLLLFEQLMANYLVDLQHIPQLFDQKATSQVTAIYRQLPYKLAADIPQIDDVINREKYNNLLIDFTDLANTVRQSLDWLSDQIKNLPADSDFDDLFEKLKAAIEGHLLLGQPDESAILKQVFTKIHNRYLIRSKNKKTTILNTIAYLQQLLPELLFSQPEKTTTHSDRLKAFVDVVVGER